MRAYNNIDIASILHLDPIVIRKEAVVSEILLDSRQVIYPEKSLFFAILISWSIAFFEYCLQVPANRLGNEVYTLPQLKIMQEVITLSVFVPFSAYYMQQPLKLDYLWAALCILGAVYFIFRT